MPEKTFNHMSLPELVAQYDAGVITQTEVRLLGLSTLVQFSDEDLLGHFRQLAEVKKSDSSKWLQYLLYAINLRYPEDNDDAWEQFEVSPLAKAEAQHSISRFRRLAAQVLSTTA